MNKLKYRGEFEKIYFDIFGTKREKWKMKKRKFEKIL